MMEAYDKYNHGDLLKNRYLKVSDISEGSYGLVSLAKDTKYSDVLVAVKYIFPLGYKRDNQYSRLSNTTGRATLSPANLRSNNGSSESKKKAMVTALCEESLREIAIHEILGDHPNIPTLIDHFDSCLVLEYCSKGDLYEAMQNDVGPTTSQDIKDVFAQILSAISYCHSKSVFHRDLKPENILIAQDWSMKVCDWGLATTQRTITNPSEFDIGSERYMAPELFDPELRSYDAAKTDLWSLGVILLTLVFHKNPFQIANYNDKRFLQFSANREALFDFFSSMTGEMFNALRFCLTMDPANRDLQSFSDELQNVKYFTIDEEYWAMHSEEEEEDEIEEEDNEYNEIEDDEEKEEKEDGGEKEDNEDDEEEEKEEEVTLPAVIVQPDETFLFDAVNAEKKPFDTKIMARCLDKQIKIITPKELPKDRMYVSIDEALECDLTLARGTATSAGEDGDMPHNRRADALLSSNTHTRPIPIGGGQQIRNTRKPFGVASYNKNGAFSAFQKDHGSYNSHSDNQGNKFRREDFFTPRSVFSHYMDKYGECKEPNEPYRTYEKKKRVWNSGRRKQSWKKKGPASQATYNRTAHATAYDPPQAKRNHRDSKRRPSRPATANLPIHVYPSSPPTHFSALANGTSPQSGCGGRSAGKYVPPFLRSPQLTHKVVAVDAVTEEIDNMAFTDEEVFVLEDDYHENNAEKFQLINSYQAHVNNTFFTDLSNEPVFQSTAQDNQRMPMPKDNSLHSVALGKYIPPFRRGSMSILADKRRPIMSSGSPFAGFLQTLLDEEASRSVPGETWLFKKDWRA